MRISDWSSDVCSSDLAVARRLADASAQVEADRRDEKAEQEGNTPAPINHMLFGEECIEQERSAERREDRDARPQLLEGAVEAAPVRRGIYAEEGGRDRTIVV